MRLLLTHAIMYTIRLFTFLSTTITLIVVAASLGLRSRVRIMTDMVCYNTIYTNYTYHIWSHTPYIPYTRIPYIHIYAS